STGSSCDWAKMGAGEMPWMPTIAITGIDMQIEAKIEVQIVAQIVGNIVLAETLLVRRMISLEVKGALRRHGAVGISILVAHCIVSPAGMQGKFRRHQPIVRG